MTKEKAPRVSRTENFSREEETRDALKSIRGLGAHKCVGYLPVDSMREYYHLSIEEEIRHAKQNNLVPLLLPNAPISFKGALFVYNPDYLGPILKKGKSILTKYKWPTDMDGFVRRVAYEQVWGDKPDLLAIIQEAFGDREK